MTSTAQKLNENETELQVLQKEDGTMTQRASSGDDPEAQIVLTEFVGRGLLIADLQ